MLHIISTYLMYFQWFPCTSRNFLSCFACCTLRRSNCARLKSIALVQFNLKIVGNLPKVLRILSKLKIKQLLQLRHKTKLIERMKPGSLSIIIFLPIHMMEVLRFSLSSSLSVFQKTKFSFKKNHAEF